MKIRILSIVLMCLCILSLLACEKQPIPEPVTLESSEATWVSELTSVSDGVRKNVEFLASHLPPEIEIETTLRMAKLFEWLTIGEVIELTYESEGINLDDEFRRGGKYKIQIKDAKKHSYYIVTSGLGSVMSVQKKSRDGEFIYGIVR
jgi:hypothetical protein